MNAINKTAPRTTTPVRTAPPKDPKIGPSQNITIGGMTVTQIQKYLGRELTVSELTQIGNNPNGKVAKEVLAKAKAKQAKLQAQDEAFRIVTMTGPAQVKNLKGTVERYKKEVAQANAELAQAKAKAKKSGANVGTSSTEVQKLEAQLAKAKQKLNDATYEYNVRESEKDQAQANRNSLDSPPSSPAPKKKGLFGWNTPIGL